MTIELLKQLRAEAEKEFYIVGVPSLDDFGETNEYFMLVGVNRFVNRDGKYKSHRIIETSESYEELEKQRDILRRGYIKFQLMLIRKGYVTQEQRENINL